MKKELVLNQPGVMELDREELKKTDGGLPIVFAIIGVAASILAVGAAIDYIAGKVVEGWNNPR